MDRPNANELLPKIKEQLQKELSKVKTRKAKREVACSLFDHYTWKPFIGISALLKSVDECMEKDEWFWNPITVDRVKENISVSREGAQKLAQVTEAFVLALVEICFGEKKKGGRL